MKTKAARKSYPPGTHDKRGNRIKPVPIDVTASSKFDPALLEKLTARFDKETELIRSTTLDNDEDQETSAARLVQVKALAKKFEATYKELRRPHNEALKRIAELVKPYERKVVLLVGAYSSLLQDYEIAKAERASAALAIAREAAAERDTETVTQALNVVKDNDASKLAGVSIKVKWVIKRVVADLLPEEYTLRVANMPKLEEIAANTPEHEEPPIIPGVVWERGASQRVMTG